VLKGRQGLVLTPRGLNSSSTTRREKQNLQEKKLKYEGWNFNSGNYLFITDTK